MLRQLVALLVLVQAAVLVRVMVLLVAAVAGWQGCVRRMHIAAARI